MSALSPRGSQAPTAPVCELKGGRFTLSVLHLHSTDLAAIDAHLANLLSQAPAFLEQAPVILEVSQLSQPDVLVLDALTDVLRRHTLIPVALRGGDAAWRERAINTGLALLPDGKTTPDNDKRPGSQPTKAPPTATGKAPQIINRPVRSGQQIYAQDTDLVILGAVSAGAEVISDGHIHIYGALRGRALAGARGDDSARIFCQSLEAELLSIAGCYRVLEAQSEETRGHPAHAWLEGERLMIEML